MPKQPKRVSSFSLSMVLAMAFVVPVTVFSGEAWYGPQGQPRYREYVRSRAALVLAKHFAGPEKWMKDISRQNVICQGAAVQCFLAQWFPDEKEKHLAGATRFLSAVLDSYGRLTQCDFFTPAPMMVSYRTLKGEGRLTGEMEAAFKRYVAKGFVARDYGAFNQPLMRFTGLAMAARDFPDLPEAQKWREGVDKEWQVLLKLGDITENAPNYNRIDLLFLLHFARESGRLEELNRPGWKAVYERFRDQQAPSGVWAAYGDSGTGRKDDRPDSPQEVQWATWAGAYEYAAAFYQDPTFTWSARKCFALGLSLDGDLGEIYGHIGEIFDLATALPYADTRLSPKPAGATSVVQVRRDFEGKTVPDKLILCPSREAGNPFAMVDLFVSGEHCHENQHGGICHYEVGGIPQTFMLGYNNREPSLIPLLYVAPGGQAFPDPGEVTAETWYEASLPLSRIGTGGGEYEPQVGPRKSIDGILFRVDLTAPATVSFGDLRLEGPAGVKILAPWDAAHLGDWGKNAPALGDISPDGKPAIAWTFGKGVSKVENRRIIAVIDTEKYTVLKFHWKISSSRLGGHGLIVWLLKNGATVAGYHADMPQLQPRLVGAIADQKGRDCYGRASYEGWFTPGARHQRRMVLGSEGILVVRDELVPDPLMKGMAAGPLWHFAGRQEPRRGNGWIDGPGGKLDSLVAFACTQPAEQGVLTADCWSVKDGRTGYLRTTVGAKPIVFITAFYPHAPSRSAEQIMARSRVSTEADASDVQLAMPFGVFRVRFGTGDDWSVERFEKP